MPSEEPRVGRKLPILRLAVVALVAAAAGVLLMRGHDYRALGEHAMAAIRAGGPMVFFAAIVALPAVGAPLSAFTLVAGEAFSRQMTLPGVVAAVLLSVIANLALTYWLARYALRPLLSWLAQRYGYTIPTVTPGNALSIALVLRLTPGPPFFMQSYILGLAAVPFRLYMVVSFLCITPWVVAFVVLGKGIFNGDFKLLLYGVGVIVAATAVVHMLRKRYAGRAD
jgi:uncharacterized membrane protein YdjX (TVP38/TMEM64 family)